MPNRQLTTAQIKARCPDPTATTDLIREHGAVHQGRDHQIDTNFALPHRRSTLRQATTETNLIHYQREDHAGPKDPEVRLHAPNDTDSSRPIESGDDRRR